MHQPLASLSSLIFSISCFHYNQPSPLICITGVPISYQQCPPQLTELKSLSAHFLFAKVHIYVSLPKLYSLSRILDYKIIQKLFLSEAVNCSFKASKLFWFHILRASIHTSWGWIYSRILRILNFKESRKFSYKLLSFQVLAWIFLYHQLIGQTALLLHHTRKWKPNHRAISDFWDKYLWSFPTQSYSGFLAQDESLFIGNSFGFTFQAGHTNHPKHGPVSRHCKWRCQVFRKTIALPFSQVVHIVKAMVSSSHHVQIWELVHKEDWLLKNWCFQTVVLEKTLESPLDSKEIKPVNLKGNQPWLVTERAIAEALILWPPDTKSQLIGKTLMLGKVEGKRRRG